MEDRDAYGGHYGFLPVHCCLFSSWLCVYVRIVNILVGACVCGGGHAPVCVCAYGRGLKCLSQVPPQVPSTLINTCLLGWCLPGSGDSQLG